MLRVRNRLEPSDPAGATGCAVGSQIWRGNTAALAPNPTKIRIPAIFTPKYVETASERENLVYRVKLRIPRETALA